MKCYGVIMAGGSGTRLWPLSRRKKPKQFLELTGRGSMLGMTMERLHPVIKKEDVYIVTGEDMVEHTRECLGGAVADDMILREPAARNTAPCIAYAAMEIVKKHGDGIMAIFASDHFIADEDEFRRVLEKGIELAKGDSLVTIGIKPTRPETGYGYIKKKTPDGFEVKKFVEKPDIETATGYVNSGEYLWNSGMFIWKASVILDHLKELLPEVYEPIRKIGDALGSADEKEVLERIYPEIPKISIDNGIMEKAVNVLVVDGDFGWSDVGSLDSLTSVWNGDDDGNAVKGSVILSGSEGNVVHGQEGKLTALIGMDNFLVIDTKDALLVCPRNRAQEVKNLLESVEADFGEAYI